MHEIVQIRHKIAAENPDLVVIAGDIGEGVKRIDECLREFKTLTCPVAVITTYGYATIMSFATVPT